MIRVGQIFANGIIIIASETKAGDQYVLALHMCPDPEYVTCLVGPDESFLYGHYSKKFNSAVADYNERLKP